MAIVSNSAIIGSGSPSSLNWSHDTGNEDDSLLLIGIFWGDSYSPISTLTVGESSVLGNLVAHINGAQEEYIHPHGMAVYAVPGVTGNVSINATFEATSEVRGVSVLLDSAGSVRDFIAEMSGAFATTHQQTVDSEVGDVVLGFASVNATAQMTQDTVVVADYNSDVKEVATATAGDPSTTLNWSNDPGFLNGAFITLSIAPASSSASVGEGALSAGASSISGSGSAFSSISGSGTLAAQAVALAGSGVVLNVRNLVLTQAQGRELRDEGGTPVELNGIIYEWYDDPDSTEGEPADSGTFNTDENGEAIVVLSNSSLTDGHVGGLLLIHPSDPTIRGYYRVPVTLSQ